MRSLFIYSRILAHGAMLLFSAVVAGSVSLGHIIANDITPAALTALRFMLAAVVMAIWTQRSCRISCRDLESAGRDLLSGSLMGTYFVLMFEGLTTAPAVSTSAVFTLTPAISAVLVIGCSRNGSANGLHLRSVLAGQAPSG